MGTEYRVEFAASDQRALARSLVSLALVRATADPCDNEFAAGPSAMPDASLHWTPEGAYCCDSGGLGREMLGQVIAAILECAPAVQVELL